MTSKTILSLLAAAALAVAAPAMAGPKPAGAKAAPGQTVANFLAGKSFEWKSCNGGGIYYGGEWKAFAYCNRNNPAIGIGTWRVSRSGTVCHDLTWYWDDDGETKSRKEPVTKEECTDLVQATDGTLYARWQGERSDQNAWWNIQASDTITPGFEHRGKFNRTKRRLGL